MAAHRGIVVEAWYSGAWWLWLLRPLEVVFRVLTAVRRWCYRQGLLAVYRASRPVVVVGNITVGGTGKTPVVIALVEHLQRAGLRPGVVSRGYGASGTVFPHRVSEHSSAADCGDEPLLIYRRTGCRTVVDPHRTAAVAALLHSAEVDVVVSDDGLQHYAMGRDMEIAVLDAESQIGNGFCLPAGPLREPAARLRSVDSVLYRGSSDPDNGVRYVATALIQLQTGAQQAFSPAALGVQVYAMAGIGQPEQFFSSLRAVGFEPIPSVFPDHHEYSEQDLAALADKPLIMTEKDAVKCADIAGPNAWYLRIDAHVPQALLDTVTALAQRPD